MLNDINTENNNQEITTKPIFNPETLEIGESLNSDKYGWKVEDYKVKLEEKVFSKSNKAGNIRGVAWLTDTILWEKYTNEDAFLLLLVQLLNYMQNQAKKYSAKYKRRRLYRLGY